MNCLEYSFMCLEKCQGCLENILKIRKSHEIVYLHNFIRTTHKIVRTPHHQDKDLDLFVHLHSS